MGHGASHCHKGNGLLAGTLLMRKLFFALLCEEEKVKGLTEEDFYTLLRFFG
jgi:hypothetical protein